MPPRTIAGRYEVLKEIGRGGMGAVWLCRDQLLGREVAVKQLGGLPGETAPHLARALREARASAALTHPNVVSIYDAVEDGDHVWLVMEHVPSQTLSALTKKEGPLPPRRAARIGAQIADGLAAAHAGGTIHRDVKPGNILVADGDLAKISDFGIARHVDDETLTQTGMVTGTPQYFSPQLARGASATPADDLWALGATLFTMVEGQPPWPHEPNALAMLVHIAENAPPRPSTTEPLRTLITRMLSVDPADRPEMAAVASELHAIAGDDDDGTDPPTLAFAAGPPTVERERKPVETPASAPVVAPLPAPVPAGPEPSYTPREESDRRRWLPIAALLAALVLLGAAGAALLFGGGDNEDPATTANDTSRESTSPSTEESPTDSEPEETASSEAPPAATTPEATVSDTELTEEPATDAAQFVTDYYALLPSNTKSAWDLLSDEMQDEVGSYGSYKGFWDTIDSVSVNGASESSGGQVTVELTYSSDAGTESETRLITVDDTGVGPQIVDDQVV
jgi:eukaryotic-like serine/threonine-protein kinase